MPDVRPPVPQPTATRPRFLIVLGWVIMVLGLLAIGRGLTRLVSGEVAAAALTCAVGGGMYLLGRLLRGGSASG